MEPVLETVVSVLALLLEVLKQRRQVGVGLLSSVEAAVYRDH